MEDFNAGQGRVAGEEAILIPGITPAVSVCEWGLGLQPLSRKLSRLYNKFICRRACGTLFIQSNRRANALDGLVADYQRSKYDT